MGACESIVWNSRIRFEPSLIVGWWKCSFVFSSTLQNADRILHRACATAEAKKNTHICSILIKHEMFYFHYFACSICIILEKHAIMVLHADAFLFVPRQRLYVIRWFIEAVIGIRTICEWKNKCRKIRCQFPCLKLETSSLLVNQDWNERNRENFVSVFIKTDITPWAQHRNYYYFQSLLFDHYRVHVQVVNKFFPSSQTCQLISDIHAARHIQRERVNFHHQQPFDPLISKSTMSQHHIHACVLIAKHQL